MKTSKLSPKMQDILDKMRAGSVAYYMPYMGRFNPSPYWFLDSTHERCTSQVEGLIKRGLVVITKKELYDVPSQAKAK